MKPNSDLLFLKQKLRILQATDEFQFQLNKARNEFNYTAALEIMGSKAAGMKHFYDRSVNLIRWIYIHKAFQQALKQHENSGYRKQVGQRSHSLSSSFLELQLSASSLLTDSFKSMEKIGVEITLNQSTYNAGPEHQLGIDILKIITTAKSEQYWIDLFEQGFKNSTNNSFQAPE